MTIWKFKIYIMIIFHCTQPPHAAMTKLLCPHHEGAGSPHPIRVGGPDLWYLMALAPPIPSGWGGLIYGIRWRWWIPRSSRAWFPPRKGPGGRECVRVEDGSREGGKGWEGGARMGEGR